MGKIPLTFGKYAEVSDEDYRWLSRYKWRLQKRRSTDDTGYAVSSRSPHTIRMHRLIMKADNTIEVDHINGNPLDNRRENLRLATRPQNVANRKAKGYYKCGNKFRVFVGGHSVGYYASEEEARKAYIENKRKLYGEFLWEKDS